MLPLLAHVLLITKALLYYQSYPMLSIHNLLNPVSPVKDAPQHPGFNREETPSPPHGTAHALPGQSLRPLSSPLGLGVASVPQSRHALVEHHIALSLNTSPRPVLPARTAEDGLLSTSYNVRTGSRGKLEILYHYARGVTLEYPETSGTGRIGHLFNVSPEGYHNPRLSFAYSQGSPSGRSTAGKHVYCEALKDDDGELVPCKESHYTCEFYFRTNHTSTEYAVNRPGY